MPTEVLMIHGSLAYNSAMKEKIFCIYGQDWDLGQKMIR